MPKKIAKKAIGKPDEGKKLKPIGKIVHYYPKIEVAVVKLSKPLSIGDSIRVIGGESTDFEQIVQSMEVDYKKIKKAKVGSSVGMKIKEKVREGYKVYMV